MYGIHATLRDKISGSILHMSISANSDNIVNNFNNFKSAIISLCTEKNYEFCNIEIKRTV